MSNESYESNIWVESFPRPGGGKWQISRNGSGQVRWQRDGRQLIYLGYDNGLTSVQIGSGGALEIGVVLGS